MSAALRIWDDLLLEHPRDALALHWAHQWDHARGDSASMRLRPARALPEWDDADPLFPCVLGLYAFGLAECHQLALAEDLGRRAIALAQEQRADADTPARVPWAVHAVTHAMEMQGRFDDGADLAAPAAGGLDRRHALREPSVVAPRAVPAGGAGRHRRAAPRRHPPVAAPR